jgi:hypothetical protein
MVGIGDAVSRFIPRRSVMIRRHPARVLSVTALTAVFFLALSYPGKSDTEGAWYYLSAIGWFGFLISFLVFLVLAVVATVHKLSGRRQATEH